MRDGRSADGLGYVVCEPRQLRSGSLFSSPERLVRLTRAWGRERTSRGMGPLRQLLVSGGCGRTRGESFCPARVLITLGDWPVVRPYDRWRRVRQLVFHGARRRNEWSHGMSASAAERSPHRPFRLRADSADAKPGERETDGRLSQGQIVGSCDASAAAWASVRE